jgi:hypothetical protein
MSNFIKVHASKWNIWFFYFQVNGNLEDTYVSSNCAYYSHNTLNVKVALNNILTNQFQIYLLPTFIILKLIFHSTYQKLNWSFDALIVLYFYWQKNLIYFFDVYANNSILGKWLSHLLYHVFGQYRVTILGITMM